MDHLPLLSLVTFLPLAGVALILCLKNENAATARWIALVTSLIVFALSILLWTGFDKASTFYQFEEKHLWLPGFQISYHMGIDGVSLLFVLLSDLPDADLYPGQLGCDQDARQRIHDRLPGSGNHDGRHVFGARPPGVLFLLRRRIAADVPDHRHLGRPAPSICRFQVLPIHADGVGPDAAGGDRALFDRGHHRHTDADAHGPGTRSAILDLAGVLCRLRGQGADVASAYLAARCARRGADGRLGHSGRRAAEDGRVRVLPYLAAHAAGGITFLHALRVRPSARSRSSIPRWSLWCSRI